MVILTLTSLTAFIIINVWSSCSIIAIAPLSLAHFNDNNNNNNNSFNTQHRLYYQINAIHHIHSVMTVILKDPSYIINKYHRKDTVTLACLTLGWSRQVYDDQLCILRPFTNHFVQPHGGMHPLHIAIRSTKIVIIYFKSHRTWDKPDSLQQHTSNEKVHFYKMSDDL